jgi:RimJ/RimL family protein N-acetyltransferase
MPITDAQREIVRRYKGYGGVSDAERTLVVRDEAGATVGSLRAIGPKEAEDDALVEKLVEWRKNNMRFFRTQFAATKARTKTWLAERVAKDDTRILFLVFDETERLVGHFGLCDVEEKSAYMDNAIRGESGGDPKLFDRVEIAVLDFGFDKLGVEKHYGELFADNFIAAAWHRSIGFEIEEKRTLTRVERDGDITHVADPDATGKKRAQWLIGMSKDEFYRRYPRLSQ